MTFDTGDHRLVTVCTVRQVLHILVRDSLIDLDVTTTCQIRGLLTIQEVAIHLKLFVLVVTVCNHQEVILLMVDKFLVGTSSEFVFSHLQ